MLGIRLTQPAPMGCGFTRVRYGCGPYCRSPNLSDARNIRARTFQASTEAGGRRLRCRRSMPRWVRQHSRRFGSRAKTDDRCRPSRARALDLDLAAPVVRDAPRSVGDLECDAPVVVGQASQANRPMNERHGRTGPSSSTIRPGMKSARSGAATATMSPIDESTHKYFRMASISQIQWFGRSGSRAARPVTESACSAPGRRRRCRCRELTQEAPRLTRDW